MTLTNREAVFLNYLISELQANNITFSFVSSYSGVMGSLIKIGGGCADDVAVVDNIVHLIDQTVSRHVRIGQISKYAPPNKNDIFITVNIGFVPLGVPIDALQ